MGVFPAASSSHVPKPWAKLMSDPVSNSPNSCSCSWNSKGCGCHHRLPIDKSFETVTDR